MERIAVAEARIFRPQPWPARDRAVETIHVDLAEPRAVVRVRVRGGVVRVRISDTCVRIRIVVRPPEHTA